MRQATGTHKSPGEKLVKDIKRATRKPSRLIITQTNPSLQNSNRSDVPFYMTTDIFDTLTG